MARKEKLVTGGEGRDKGKTFVVREMPTVQGEKWAWRALLALARSGVVIPPDLMEQGWRTIAQVGLGALAGMPFYEAEPLLDEMRAACFSIREQVGERPLTDDDVEELETLFLLRREALGLHVDFSKVAAFWTSRMVATTDQNPPDIQTTPP